VTPLIRAVTRNGKNLIVDGEGFITGSKILLKGQTQKTVPDIANPTTRLIGKKLLKKLQPGETAEIQVVNPSGITSNSVPFTR
jgi:hypothetical protein